MSPREHRASLRRDTQEGSYCAQFKTYHDEMKENENEEPSVTEAELARVLELDAKATQGPWESVDPGPLRDCRRIFAPNARYIGTVDNSDGHNTYGPDAALIAEYRTLTPRLARELAAARAAIKVARSFLLRSTHRDGCPKFGIFPKECTCGYDEAFNALNTHTLTPANSESFGTVRKPSIA